MIPQTRTGQRLPASVSLIAWLAIAYVPALVGGLLMGQTDWQWYAELAKPTWNPPSWVFGPVWTILYATMGLAGWMVWRQPPTRARSAGLTAFGVQWVLNAAWTGLFFTLQRPDLAFYEIAVLWIALGMTVLLFAAVRKAAAVLLLPYFAWVSFATALNFTIWRMNAGG